MIIICCDRDSFFGTITSSIYGIHNSRSNNSEITLTKAEAHDLCVFKKKIQEILERLLYVSLRYVSFLFSKRDLTEIL